MSIDATILNVEPEGPDLILTLVSRLDDNDRASLRGQPQLRILNATWRPEPGHGHLGRWLHSPRGD
jgi:hypothetical protein